MTNEQKLKLIKQLIEHRQNIDAFCDKFAALFGSFPGNGECGYEVFERLFSDYMLLVSEKIDDTEYGIDWFVWENDCGKKKMKAGYKNGEMMVIDSAEAYLNYLKKQ